MPTREHIISTLRTALEPEPAVRAAWLGGSDATGRLDSESDIDLYLIVKPGTVEACASLLERALTSLAPVEASLRLPMPTWHGFHQAFCRLAGTPEWLMVDWLMIEAGTPHPWLDVERHGTPRVLFDKDGLVTPSRGDPAARARAIARRVEEIRSRFTLFRHLAAKNAGRGLPVDAWHFYHTLALRPLIDLLRIVHCPERFDYGPRYLRDDLPAADYQRVCRLAYPRDVNEIPRCMDEINGLVAMLLARVDGLEPRAV